MSAASVSDRAATSVSSKYVRGTDGSLSRLPTTARIASLARTD
jgi:hypothetical protein